MGHGKLRKFAENETFSCLVQQAGDDTIVSKDEKGRLILKDHPLKGKWNGEMFKKAQPIVLELGCGRGEYTIDLSRREPENNYIGVDIKGARLWKGAKYAHENNLPNVAFLRTRIEFIESFFSEGEVSQIWLTFSDPQLKKENNRLTSPVFLERYRKFLSKGGVVHLKTDSMFLHQYTKAVCKANSLNILSSYEDLYAEGGEGPVWEVKTFYERMFLKQGLPITYLSFTIDHEGPYVKPDFDDKYWREREAPRTTNAHDGSLRMHSDE